MKIRALFALCVFVLSMATPAAASKTDRHLDLMIGQMIMVGFRGLDVNSNSAIMEDVRARHIGGVILFDRDVALKSPVRNIQSPDQVRALITKLQGEAMVPLLVSVDQEGGRVQRLKSTFGFETTPSAKVIGDTGNDWVAAAAGRTVGRTLSEVGFNLDFAPVVDVNVNPKSPAIGALGRSFSSDPEAVGQFAGAFIKGLHQYGVLSCLKHFPGHGSAVGDSHHGVTDVSKTWTDKELIPYMWLIRNNLADMIMTAHIYNSDWDDVPATLSKRVLTDLLRKRMKYDGVIITDDMDMKGVAAQYNLAERVYLAINAGADILLFGNNLTHDPQVAAKVHRLIKNFVQSGKIKRSRIEESFHRILRLKMKQRRLY